MVIESDCFFFMSYRFSRKISQITFKELKYRSCIALENNNMNYTDKKDQIKYIYYKHIPTVEFYNPEMLILTIDKSLN